MTRMAITSSVPMPRMEFWYSAAVPWKAVRTVSGSVSRANCSTRPTASPSETPGSRLNEMVTAGNWPRCAMESGADSIRQRLARQLLHAPDRLAERNSGQQVERDGHRRQLAQVRDGKRSDLRAQPGQRVELHHLPARRADVEPAQGSRIEPEPRQ